MYGWEPRLKTFYVAKAETSSKQTFKKKKNYNYDKVQQVA